MSNILLKYNTENLVDLTYDQNGANQKVFDNCNVARPFINITSENGIALNGTKFSNIYYKHKEFDLVFSSDTVDDEGISFLENWFSSNFKYMALPVGDSYTNYFEVITNGGRIPISYLENLEFLPEFSFTIFKKEKE